MPTMTGQSAYDFIQSVGMNLHLDRTDGQWQNRPFIMALLKALGIRWVRSSLNILPGPNSAYANFLQKLDNGDAVDAIRSIQIIAHGTTAEQIIKLVSMWGVSFFEGPNELDIANESTWIADDLAQIAQITAAIQHWNGNIAFIAPSVSMEDPAEVSSSFYDYANMHDYFGDRPPETIGWGADVYSNGTVYGSEAFNIATARRAAPGRPVISTESGYATDPGKLTEYTQATYLERLLLVSAMEGVTKRILYDLCDDDQNYGIVQRDGSPKLALKALIGFLSILSDSAAQKNGSPVTLDATITSSATICSHLIYKNNGEKDLILWQPAQIQDPNNYEVTLPEPATVSVASSVRGNVRAFSQTPSFDWLVEEYPDLTSLQITERPMIIALNAGLAPKLPFIPSP